MSDKAEMPKSLVFDLFSQDRGYVNMVKSQDNLTSKNSILIIDKDYVSRSMSEFNRSTGIVANGKEIRIEGKDPYFKITNDYKIESMAYENRLIRMNELFDKEIPGFFMFIDGEKVPDNEILIYPSESYCDIFLPLIDFQDLVKEKKVYFESVYFHNQEYIHYYNPRFKSRTITLEISYEKDTYIDKESFNENKGMVYQNGKLIDPSLYTVALDNNTLTVTFKIDVFGKIEFFYNPSLSYKKYVKYDKTQSLSRLLMNIDKDAYLHIARGGVPKIATQVYINGLRITGYEVEQIGRQHYRIEKEDKIDVDNYSLIIQDYDTKSDENLFILGSDYYLQRMIGIERLNKGYMGENIGMVFDDFKNFNVYEIMCNSGKMYNSELNVKFFKYIRSSDTTVNTKLAQVIDRNPNLMKDFLKKFAKTKIRKYYRTGNQAIDNFTVSTGTYVDEEKQISNYDIFINGNYVGPEAYDKENINGNNLITIDGDRLKPNAINLLEGTETIVNKKNVEFYTKKVPNSDIIRSANTADPNKMSYLLRKEEYGDKFSGIPSDVIILRKVEGNLDLLYASSANIGFQTIDATVIPNEDGIQLYFNEIFDEDIIIYFKNFYYKTSFIFYPSESQALENMAFVSYGPSTEPLPILAKGTPKLFVNNEYYLYGVDYSFVTPENNAKMAASAISFIKATELGSNISFEIEEVSNKIFISKYNVPYYSKYGLLYFSALPFPFSLDYMELYIDGIKVTNDMIQILSDKLIRVKTLKVPFTDIYLATTFKYNYSEIEPYLSFYKEDNFEKILAELFKAVDFTIDDNSDAKYDPDEIYKSFEPDIGVNPGGNQGENKEENPDKEPGDIPNRTSQYVEKYMRWLISDDARSVLDTGTAINNQVLDYFSLYNLGFGEEGKDIIVDTGTRTLVDKDILVNAGLPYSDKKTRLLELINMMKENSVKEKDVISTLDAYEAYSKDKLSNKYLLEGFPLMERSINFENQLPKNIVVSTIDNDKLDFNDVNVENIKTFRFE